MKIWVDCDGVLADFHSQFLNLYELLSGEKYTLKNWTTFGAEKCFGKPEVHDLCWEMIDVTPGFVYKMPWLPDAQEALEILRKKHWVGLATKPHKGPLWAYERQCWAEAVAGFSQSKLALMGDKFHLQGDLLIEDNLANAIAYTKKNENAFAILKDAPYNQFENETRELPSRVIRCNDWWEILSTVDAIEGLLNA